MHVSEEIDIIGSDMHVSLEIIAIGSNYACFSCNTRSWLKRSALYSGELNLSRRTYVAFEMVGVCLDCRGFS